MAVIFSPPVILLCLFILLMRTNHEWAFSTNSFNAREFRRFQRFFGNPCHFNRYFDWGTAPSGRCGGTTGHRRESGNADRYPTATASGTTRPPAARGDTELPRTTAPNDQPPGNDSPSHDFELVSPIQLMMALAGTDSNSNTDNEAGASSPPTSNGSEQDLSDDGDNKSEFTKIPVHRLETQEALVISMDVSGFDSSQLHVTVENTTKLCIRGERTNKIGDRFVLEENLDLVPQEFDIESVTANASNGILQVRVGKKVPPRPRVISINGNVAKID
jgi:HSP20 family molecular chaperone IbpA